MGWRVFECRGSGQERIVDRHDCRAINPDIRCRSMAELEDFQHPGSTHSSKQPDRVESIERSALLAGGATGAVGGNGAKVLQEGGGARRSRQAREVFGLDVLNGSEELEQALQRSEVEPIDHAGSLFWRCGVFGPILGREPRSDAWRVGDIKQCRGQFVVLRERPQDPPKAVLTEADVRHHEVGRTLLANQLQYISDGSVLHRVAGHDPSTQRTAPGRIRQRSACEMPDELKAAPARLAAGCGQAFCEQRHVPHRRICDEAEIMGEQVLVDELVADAIQYPVSRPPMHLAPVDEASFGVLGLEKAQQTGDVGENSCRGRTSAVACFDRVALVGGAGGGNLPRDFDSRLAAIVLREHSQRS
ncbi:unnamed protein product, partial [Brugia timori]|uniref:Uncharacterized protein n=1 Tax=Brugia timori TaxID=42155 RepID=A0A0R3QG17_9BILA